MNSLFQYSTIRIFIDKSTLYIEYSSNKYNLLLHVELCRIQLLNYVLEEFLYKGSCLSNHKHNQFLNQLLCQNFFLLQI